MRRTQTAATSAILTVLISTVIAASPAPATAGTYWKCSPNQAFKVYGVYWPHSLTMLQTTCLDRERDGSFRATVRVREDKRTRDDYLTGSLRVELRDCENHSLIAANPRTTNVNKRVILGRWDVLYGATYGTSRSSDVYAVSWVGKAHLFTGGSRPYHGRDEHVGKGRNGQSTYSYTCLPRPHVRF